MALPYYFKVREALTDLSQRDETNYLLDFLNHAMKNLDKHGEKDIRHDYFGFMKDLIINYSFNIKNFYLRAFLEYEKESSLTLEELKNITEEEFKGVFDPIFSRYKSIKTGLERGLIVEAWSLFEFSITIIFEHILPIGKDALRKEKYSGLLKSSLKKHFPQNLETIELAIEEITSKLDPFIPTINKINKIFKMHGASYEEKKNDIEFLTFFGRLRNGIHHNFIYKGEDKEDFEFKGNVYKFKDGEYILEYAQGHFDVMDLLEELFNVILRYFRSLNINEKIFNPIPTIDEL